MKRIMKFAGIIAASAALMVCCSKEASYDDVATDPSTQQQGDTNPSIVSGEVLDSFGAKFENDVNTKVSITIDEKNARLAFVDRDPVLVVSGSSTAKYVYDGDGKKFVPESDPLTLGENVEVYYPFDEFDFDGSSVVFTMPDAVEDLDDLGAKNPLAAQLSGNDTDGYTATFKAVGSVLQVGVTGNRELSSVVLSSGSNPIGQGTKYTVGWSSTVPTMEVREGSSKSISISSSAELTDSPTTFYFILPAGITLAGVTATANLTTTDATGSYMFYIERNGDWTPVRKEFSTMSFYAGLFSGGTGTSEDPYIIAKARDFKNISKYCSSGYNALANTHFLGAYYKQTANIDFKNVQMAPIGDSGHHFTGHYDGNHKELQNVNINETGQFAGIFAYVNGSASSASIKDLTVSGNITKTGSTENSCVGGIAGIVRGDASVSGCTNNATINSSATYTGGIAGRLYSSTSSTAISGCTNNGSVTSTALNVGGIVGQHINGGTISECVNTGTISGTRYVGGIVGDMGYDGNPPSAISFISFCRNDATINASANCSGGIAGRIINGSVVSSCFAKGTVNSESYDVGGIAGVVQVNQASGKTLNTRARVCVYDCLTAMDVTTTRSGSSNDTRTGGAVGCVLNTTAQYIAIDNCGVIASSVTVGGGAKVGGFAGDLYSSNSNKNRTRIRNSYTLVSTISSPDSQYGGFVGATHSIDGKNTAGYGEMHHCYYVADATNTVISTNVTQDDIEQKQASEIASAATCDTFNANTYVLTIGSNDYGSSLGWAIPAGCDYPVPGSLRAKGEEYYK